MEPEESRVSESILQFNHSLAVGQRPLECSGFTIAEEIHGFRKIVEIVVKILISMMLSGAAIFLITPPILLRHT